MAPMFLSVDWENEPSTYYEKCSYYDCKPKKEMVDGYNQVSSKIMVPQKPKIIT